MNVNPAEFVAVKYQFIPPGFGSFSCKYCSEKSSTGVISLAKFGQLVGLFHPRCIRKLAPLNKGAIAQEKELDDKLAALQQAALTKFSSAQYE